MHARSTWSRGRARLTALTAGAVLALGSALMGANPAMAATTPTLTGPTSVNGWTWATMTGTARAGATVTLYEAAYVFRTDMAPAEQFFPEDIVQTTADSSGRFTLRRRLDSGFRFQAEADGLMSEPLDIGIVPIPHLAFSTSGTDVTVDLLSEPSQDGLPVLIQRLNGSTWTTVVSGHTLNNGKYNSVLTAQSGTQSYRAVVGPDTSNRVLVGTSVTVTLTVGSSTPPVVTDPDPTPTTPTPTPTTPTPTPTTPKPTTPAPTKPTTPKPTTPKPTTPKPTTPAPSTPKAGELRFSMVVYNPAGADTASKLNQEYFRITNYTTKTFNLRGWSVKDRAGNTYRFTSDFLLRGYKNVYVPTGRGTNGKPANYRYWGKSSFIWNNTGDAAYLRTGTNKLIDSCSWGNGSGKTSC
jgi:Lamin Tail Domain